MKPRDSGASGARPRVSGTPPDRSRTPSVPSKTPPAPPGTSPEAAPTPFVGSGYTSGPSRSSSGAPKRLPELPERLSEPPKRFPDLRKDFRSFQMCIGKLQMCIGRSETVSGASGTVLGAPGMVSGRPEGFWARPKPFPAPALPYLPGLGSFSRRLLKRRLRVNGCARFREQLAQAMELLPAVFEQPAGEEEDLEVLHGTGLGIPACRDVVGQLLGLLLRIGWHLADVEDVPDFVVFEGQRRFHSRSPLGPAAGRGWSASPSMDRPRGANSPSRSGADRASSRQPRHPARLPSSGGPRGRRRPGGGPW